MKLYTDSGELTLPRDFFFEIQAKNPFFSNDGTASVPVTLPADDNNRRILCDPQNLNRATRATRVFNATLETGVFAKQCKLVVDAADPDAGISISLALQESSLYADIQERSLPDIFGEWPFLFSRMADSPFDIFHGISENGLSYDFTFFPVAVDMQEQNGTVAVSVLNNPGTEGFQKPALKVENTTIPTPDDYGTAPFMYLHAMVRRTFELCGYTVAENALATDMLLQKLVVLHNCADPIERQNPGSSYIMFNYRNIVPDITVGELIRWLHDKFGAVVSVREKNVRIRLWKDFHIAGSTFDLSRYARDGYSIKYPEPKGLVYGVDTSIDSAAPAADSLEDLRDAHPTYVQADSESNLPGTGLFFIPALGKYYHKPSSSADPVMVGTGAFPYRRNTEVEAVEEISASDLFVPMVRHTTKGVMPYVGESVRRVIDSPDKDTSFKQPLMVCLALFADGCCFGTTTGRTPAGARVMPSLTPEDLFAYWYVYENMIINGAPEVSCKLDIPLSDLMTIDMWSMMSFRGAHVFIKDIKFRLDSFGAAVCDAVLQLVPAYTDSVEIPSVSFGTSLEWELVNTCSVSEWGNTRHGIRIIERDGLADYTPADAPSYSPTKTGEKAMGRDRWFRYKEYYSSFFVRGESTKTHRYREYFQASNTGI